jgi:hypothetical protein
MTALRLALPVMLLALAGCQETEPRLMTLSFSSYGATPAVVLDFQVNGVSAGIFPTVVAGEADGDGRRAGSGSYGLDYPAGGSGTVTLRAEWVELFTQRAWRSEITAPLSEFSRETTFDRGDTLLLMPVFGPNGLMLVTSDPIPTTATDDRRVDVAQTCGTRLPEADFDYTANPSALPQLGELLDFDYPEVAAPACPDPEG